jgi:predicted NAD/FAD-binding protein
MRIGVVGAGGSGPLAGRLLDVDHDVHVFEANCYAGGHTNTVAFEAFGRCYQADTGFMVFDDRAYPNFVAMVRLLGLPGRPSEMSFSVRSDRSGLEYQDGSLNGLSAQRRNQSLALLGEGATDSEREILSSFPYQPNETVLHVDSSMLPRARRAWASWNRLLPGERERPEILTYNLNRLQGHRSPGAIRVTLNDTRDLDETRIVQRILYQHPTSSRAAVAAQKRFQEINGRNRTYFCGAYWEYGFHDDGVNSALAVAQCFRRRLESLQAAYTNERYSIGA